MTQVRAITLNLQDVEKKLLAAKLRGVKECIYVTCVGYNRYYSPEQILSLVQKIHEHGMKPILFSEENTTYRLTAIEVEAGKERSEVLNIAESASKTHKSAVILKQEGEYYIYGVSSSQQWELKRLPNHLFNEIVFTKRETPIPQLLLKPELYAAIKAVDGHSEMNKWLMENSASIQFTKKVGGAYQELSTWENNPLWKSVYEQLNVLMTSQHFGKVNKLLSKDIAEFVSATGKYMGIAEDQAKEHILKCIAHTICISACYDKQFVEQRVQSSPKDDFCQRLLLCTHVAKSLEAILHSHMTHFKLENNSLKVIRLLSTAVEKLSQSKDPNAASDPIPVLCHSGQSSGGTESDSTGSSPGSVSLILKGLADPDLKRHSGISSGNSSSQDSADLASPHEQGSSGNSSSAESDSAKLSPKLSPQKQAAPSSPTRKIATGTVASKIMASLIDNGNMDDLKHFMIQYQLSESVEAVEDTIAGVAVDYLTVKKRPNVVRGLFDTIKSTATDSVSNVSELSPGRQSSGSTFFGGSSSIKNTQVCSTVEQRSHSPSNNITGAGTGPTVR